MQRWAFIAALTLPLPFAALPLVAITLNSSAATLPENDSVAREVVEEAIDPLEEGASDSLGFRIDTEAEIGCSGSPFQGS